MSAQKEIINDKDGNPLDPNKRYAFAPKEGFVWNPMRDYPRNMLCFCGSARKFKKCCIDKIPQCIKAGEETMGKHFIKAVLAGRFVPPINKAGQPPVNAQPEEVANGPTT